jgi:hypothetical protein
MKTTVITQFEVEGFHNYPEAPKQVDFLSSNHRHTFIIKCGYEVEDLNREKEIFICRDEVKSYLIESFGYPCIFENMSCEMIAKEIIEFASEDGMIWCEVWEEKTGGARVEI